MQNRLWAELIAEAFGTCVLIMFGTGVVDVFDGVAEGG